MSLMRQETTLELESLLYLFKMYIDVFFGKFDVS